MVNFCSIYGCSTRSNRDSVSFYVIPKVIDHRDRTTFELSSQRRTAWLSKIKRKDFKPTKYTRICSKHFVTGKPSALFDNTNPDWVPSLQLDSEETAVTRDTSRYRRGKAREENKAAATLASQLLDDEDHVVNPLATTLPDVPTIPDLHTVREAPTIPEAATTEEDEPVASGGDVQSDVGDDDSKPAGAEASSSAAEDPDMVEKMRGELQRLLSENYKLRASVETYQFREESFRGNDERVKFFTGLPTFLVLSVVFDLISPVLATHGRNSLSKFQQVIIVLMRLRLNLSLQDLAERFQTSKSTMSRTFVNVLRKMYNRLKFLLIWPEREQLRLTMPMIFRRHFGTKVVVIIDCFEVFCEKPSGFKARSQTWSSYKHHNTVKFLIGVTPQGTVSFLSKAWGGRASDKIITEQCGILNKLLPGDVVMADRGFDISSSVGLMCAELKIPAFTKGKKQLSPLEVETTRKIANVRIHVERVIGLVRNKYTILQGIIPIDYLKSEDSDNSIIDKIATVCCALINVCDPIVPFD